MAFGANSSMFREWPRAVFGGGQTADVMPAGPYAGLGADVVKVALFNNSVTPDKDAARTSTGFNTGTWTTTNEVVDTLNSNWATTGRALGTRVFDTTNAGIFMLDAPDLAGGGTLTVTNAYGCLVYDDTITAGTGGIADQGVTFHSFGGAQTVTAGTFTIVWHANGLFRITCS